MNATIANLKREAAKLGATVDDSTLRSGFLNVDAPAGKVWATSGDIHALCVNLEKPDHGTLLGSRPDTAWRQDAIRDALERMSAGLMDCPFPDCDACQENAK